MVRLEPRFPSIWRQLYSNKLNFLNDTPMKRFYFCFTSVLESISLSPFMFIICYGFSTEIGLEIWSSIRFSILSTEESQPIFKRLRENSKPIILRHCRLLTSPDKDYQKMVCFQSKKIWNSLITRNESSPNPHPLS